MKTALLQILILMMITYNNVIQLNYYSEIEFGEPHIQTNIVTSYTDLSGFLEFEDSDLILSRVFDGLKPVSPHNVFKIDTVDVICTDENGNIEKKIGYELVGTRSNVVFILAQPEPSKTCYIKTVNTTVKYRELHAKNVDAVIEIAKNRSKVKIVNKYPYMLVAVLETQDGELIPKIINRGANYIYVASIIKNVYLYDGLNLYQLPNIEIKSAPNIPFIDYGMYSQPVFTLVDFPVKSVEITDKNSALRMGFDIEGNNKIIIKYPSQWPPLYSTVAIMQLSEETGNTTTTHRRNVNIFPVARLVGLKYDYNNRELLLEYSRPIITSNDKIEVTVNINNELCGTTTASNSINSVSVALNKCKVPLGLNTIEVIMKVHNKLSNNEYIHTFRFSYYIPFSRDIISVEDTGEYVKILTEDQIYTHLIIEVDNRIAVEGFYSLPNNFYIGEHRAVRVYIEGYKFIAKRRCSPYKPIVALLVLILTYTTIYYYKNRSIPFVKEKLDEKTIEHLINTKYKLVASNLLNRTDVYVKRKVIDHNKDVIYVLYTTPVGRGVLTEISLSTGEIIKNSITSDIEGIEEFLTELENTTETNN